MSNSPGKSPKPQVIHGLGTICRALVTDENFQNEKLRPVLVISKTQDIRPDGDVYVACITTSYKRPATKPLFALPWAADGSCSTKLRQECAVKCVWIRLVPHQKLKPPFGRLDNGQLLPILHYINSLKT